MKKIGIITIFNVENYGAELQAYATQKALQQMGYDAEIINYPYFVSPRHKATKMSAPIFPIPLRLKVIKRLLPLISWAKTLKQDKNIVKARRHNFESFHVENTKLSPEYRTMEELYANATDYNVCIVGSDQVWNPLNNTSLDPYFLKFAQNGTKRISYASSIGLSSLPKHTHNYYREAFNALDAISVREENATELVRSVSGKSAQWVLDPTLLLNSDDWCKVAKPLPSLAVSDKPYVLLYELTPCPYLKTLAEHVANIKQAKIVRITKDALSVEKDGSVLNVPEAGPAEYLWLFKNAAFVVTNSFHGTAFSINMNKDFYVVTPARKQNNSRQQSILRLFELTTRLLLEDSPLPPEEQMTIDYAPVNKKLEEQREQSKNYLRINIDGE